MRYFRNEVQFNDDQHEKAWLIKVTVNCSKTLLTSHWFKRTTSLDENLTFESSYKSELFYAVIGLPQKYRIVVHLYYYENYSIKEISKTLDLKESTIQSQLMRARKMIKKVLKGDDV